MNLKQSKEVAAVSKGNSKMPGTTFSLSAKRCKVGGKLAQVEGSVCHKCYALRLQNFRPNVDAAWERNTTKTLEVLASNPTLWVEAMATQIRAGIRAQEYHRWFDSGDLQSVQMLQAIYDVARATPDTKHWLPTREGMMVKRAGEAPDNLVVRVSATMIDDGPVRSHPWTSTVHKDKPPSPGSYVCPAKSEAHRALRSDRAPNCGPCRACWDRAIPNISYPLN